METTSDKNEPPLTAWQIAEHEGIDMSLLEITLAMTPEERIRAHERALATAQALRQAMEKRRAGA